jgi:hypothetical protein
MELSDIHLDEIASVKPILVFKLESKAAKDLPSHCKI